MNLLNSLKIYAKRQGDTGSKNMKFALDQVLSTHCLKFELRGVVLPKELSVFAQMNVGNTLIFDRKAFNIEEIEINEQRLRVQHA